MYSPEIRRAMLVQVSQTECLQGMHPIFESTATSRYSFRHCGLSRCTKRNYGKVYRRYYRTNIGEFRSLKCLSIAVRRIVVDIPSVGNIIIYTILE